MGATIKQTVYEVLEPGTYRGQLNAAALEDSEYGSQVAVRFDLLEPGYEDKSIRAWASAKLTGGKRPSKLYTWCSALLFSGRPLPEGFDLDIDHLVGRQALLVLEVVQKDGVDRNRVAQLIPLRRNGAAPEATGAPAPAPQKIPLTQPAGGVPVNTAVPDPDMPAWLTGDDEELLF